MTETIYQGDTVELDYTIENRNLSENWRCRIQVKTSINQPVLLTKELSLNTSGSKFVGQLQTASLTPGSYFVFAQLDNTVTGDSAELHNRLVIRQQGFTE